MARDLAVSSQTNDLSLAEQGALQVQRGKIGRQL